MIVEPKDDLALLAALDAAAALERPNEAGVRAAAAHALDAQAAKVEVVLDRAAGSSR